MVYIIYNCLLLFCNYCDLNRNFFVSFLLTEGGMNPAREYPYLLLII